MKFATYKRFKIVSFDEIKKEFQKHLRTTVWSHGFWSVFYENGVIEITYVLKKQQKNIYNYQNLFVSLSKELKQRMNIDNMKPIRFEIDDYDYNVSIKDKKYHQNVLSFKEVLKLLKNHNVHSECFINDPRHSKNFMSLENATMKKLTNKSTRIVVIQQQS